MDVFGGERRDIMHLLEGDRAGKKVFSRLHDFPLCPIGNHGKINFSRALYSARAQMFHDDDIDLVES